MATRSTLLSTGSLSNYRPLFELMSVKLLGANDTAIDLTNSSWSYKSGLAGEYRQVHFDKPDCKWQSHNGSIPVNMIKLLFKYDASANLRTAGNEIIENLLPLHVAVENTCLHKYLEDNLFPCQDHRDYIYKLIQLLCLPEMALQFAWLEWLWKVYSSHNN